MRFQKLSRNKLLWTMTALAFLILILPSAFLQVVTSPAQFLIDKIFGTSTANPYLMYWAVGFAMLIALVYFFAFVTLSRVATTIIQSDLDELVVTSVKCSTLVIALSESRTDTARIVALAPKFAGQAGIIAQSEKEFRAFVKNPKVDGISSEDATIMSNNWQQSVRAVHALGAGLQGVIVLVSSRSAANWPDYKIFMQILYPHIEFRRHDLFLFGRESTIAENTFHDPKYLTNILDQVLEKLLQNQIPSIAENQVCLDCTGGTKIYSIVAAIATLNRKIRLMYVNNEGNPMLFRANIQTADSLMRALA